MYLRCQIKVKLLGSELDIGARIMGEIKTGDTNLGMSI